jgi:hypothetical protein
MMVCIPTHVRAAPDDPELVRAWCALLTDRRCLGLAEGSDAAEVNDGARWSYRYSTPYVGERGDIVYVHLFRHERRPATHEPLTIGIHAARGWWPDEGAQVLSPPRSRPTASLRLVS